MVRICEYGDIQNITLTPDKKQNIVMYLTLSYVVIYKSYTLLKWSAFCPLCAYIQYILKLQI